VLHYAKHSVFRSQFFPAGNLISSHQSVQSVSKSSTYILFDGFERAICFSLFLVFDFPLMFRTCVVVFSLRSYITSPLSALHLHRLLYPSSLLSCRFIYVLRISQVPEPPSWNTLAFQGLWNTLKMKWRYFSIQCSPISERALLFGKFPGFDCSSFW